MKLFIDYSHNFRLKLNMKKPLLITSILMVLLIGTVSFAKDVSFTQEDRDRLVRIETKINREFGSVNQHLDSINSHLGSLERKIDGLQQSIYILICVMFAQTIGVVGSILWNRRTALQPALRKSEELEERQDKIEKALKEIAKVDSKVAEILKDVGLLH